MTGRSDIRQNTTELLVGLGCNPEQVASSLEMDGAKGEPKNPERCAVAGYLHAVITVEDRVSAVNVNRCTVRIRRSSRLKPATVVRLPEAVQQFIVMFDAGSFPQLIAGLDRQHAGT